MRLPAEAPRRPTFAHFGTSTATPGVWPGKHECNLDELTYWQTETTGLCYDESALKRVRRLIGIDRGIGSAPQVESSELVEASVYFVLDHLTR